MQIGQGDYYESLWGWKQALTEPELESWAAPFTCESLVGARHVAGSCVWLEPYAFQAPAGGGGSSLYLLVVHGSAPTDRA